MMRAKLITAVVVCLSIYCTNAVKKQIIKEVNICKRNDPEIWKCYCDNFNTLIPMFKNGIPEMNLMSIEPMHLGHIRLELPETKNVHFKADCNKVTFYGLSQGRANNCEGTLTDDIFRMSYKFDVPEIVIKSNYEANAKLLMIAVNATGDLNVTVTGVEVYTNWNSSIYTKNSEEYLKVWTENADIKFDKLIIHLSNILGNNEEFNADINEIINANTDLLFDEIKPGVLEAMRNYVMKLANDVFGSFPFDVLFPKN